MVGIMIGCTVARGRTQVAHTVAECPGCTSFQGSQSPDNLLLALLELLHLPLQFPAGPSCSSDH